MGISENQGYPNYFGVLTIRILLFRILYQGRLISEPPPYDFNIHCTAMPSVRWVSPVLSAPE